MRTEHLLVPGFVLSATTHGLSPYTFPMAQVPTMCLLHRCGHKTQRHRETRPRLLPSRQAPWLPLWLQSPGLQSPHLTTQ